MQAYIDQRAVKRNATIGKLLTYGGLVLAGIGVVMAFGSPEQYDRVLPLFLAGLISSQIGTPVLNRWGRSPRMDEVLDSHLKGLDARFSIWHYLLGASHALFTPAGVFALVPRVEEGLIEYDQGSWYATPTKKRFLRRTRRRKLPPVEKNAQTEVRRLHKKLKRSFGDELELEVQPLIVFVHPEARLQKGDFPQRVAHVKKLKEAIRRLPKGPSLEAEQIEQLLPA